MRTFEENYKMKDKNTIFTSLKNKQLFKMESISKLSNYNFHWTKTLCQNNFNHIAFLFTLFEGYKLEKCTKEIMRYGLKYSSTRFLSPENKNYSIS